MRRLGSFMVAVLCVGALGGGLARAAPVREPEGYRLVDYNAPVPSTLRGGRVIHAKALEILSNRPGVVLIDVSNQPQRPAEMAPGAPWMPLPHRGLPGAHWMPGVGEGVLTADLDAAFRQHLAAAAGSAGVDASLVIYCHEACWLSWNAAKRAIGYGYRRVSWFADGVEGWSAAGGPTVVLEPEQLVETTPQAPPLRLLVLDIELTGDLGGPEFTSAHEARLARESTRLRTDLENTRMYAMVSGAPAQSDLDRLRSQQAYLHDCNGCDLDIGRQLGAEQVLVAWVNRVSGLILTLTYELHDVASGQIAARKSYDFRGDNDTAWDHAVDYMVRDMQRSARERRDVSVKTDSE